MTVKLSSWYQVSWSSTGLPYLPACLSILFTDSVSTTAEKHNFTVRDVHKELSLSFYAGPNVTSKCRERSRKSDLKNISLQCDAATIYMTRRESVKEWKQQWNVNLDGAPLGWWGVYLLKDKVNGASRVDVHKVDISVAVDELCTPRHGVREAAFHLETQFGFQNWGHHQKLLFRE